MTIFIGVLFVVAAGITLRADVLRAAPAAAALVQMLARLRLRANSSENAARSQEEQKPSDGADLARAARNGLG